MEEGLQTARDSSLYLLPAFSFVLQASAEILEDTLHVMLSRFSEILQLARGNKPLLSLKTFGEQQLEQSKIIKHLLRGSVETGLHHIAHKVFEERVPLVSQDVDEGLVELREECLILPLDALIDPPHQELPQRSAGILVEGHPLASDPLGEDNVGEEVDAGVAGVGVERSEGLTEVVKRGAGEQAEDLVEGVGELAGLG